MPKLKTHKGAAARFKISGTGKLLRMKGHRSHLRRKKSNKVKINRSLFKNKNRSNVQRAAVKKALELVLNTI